MIAPNDERLAFVIGQVHALMSFALAVCQSHPDQALLKREFQTSAQAGLARLESALTSDKAIDGFQDAAAKLRKGLSEIFREGD
jgi:hypothetical protein